MVVLGGSADRSFGLREMRYVTNAVAAGHFGKALRKIGGVVAGALAGGEVSFVAMDAFGNRGPGMRAPLKGPGWDLFDVGSHVR